MENGRERMPAAQSAAGRIPGAVHLEWLNYIDGKTKEFKPANELRALFEQHGVKPESEIITY